MQFSLKLQALRKEHDLTQEQLAEKLYVSRTAVSKWETGRGMPNIESIRAIASLFEVSVDSLISGEELVEAARSENCENLRQISIRISPILQLVAALSLLLPLYGQQIDGYIYSVSLFSYQGVMKIPYIVTFALLVTSGLSELLVANLQQERLTQVFAAGGYIIFALSVLFLIAAREPYAASLLFVILLAKIWVQRIVLHRVQSGLSR